MRTSHKSPVLLLSALLLLAAGCVSPVDVAFDANETFERFRTWNWQTADASRIDAPGDNAVALAGRTSMLIAEALAARGFERDRVDPDFTVAFHLSVLPRRERVAVPRAPYLLSSHDHTPSYWIEGTDVVERSFEELSLRIEVSRHEGHPVWKGATKERVEVHERPDLSGAIEQLLGRFPPPSQPVPPKLEPDQLAWLEN